MLYQQLYNYHKQISVDIVNVSPLCRILSVILSTVDLKYCKREIVPVSTSIGVYRQSQMMIKSLFVNVNVYICDIYSLITIFLQYISLSHLFAATIQYIFYT